MCVCVCACACACACVCVCVCVCCSPLDGGEKDYHIRPHHHCPQLTSSSHTIQHRSAPCAHLVHVAHCIGWSLSISLSASATTVHYAHPLGGRSVLAGQVCSSLSAMHGPCYKWHISFHVPCAAHLWCICRLCGALLGCAPLHFC